MAENDIFSFLVEAKKLVGARIFEMLPVSHTIPEVERLYTMMRDYPSRPGKWLRSGLCLLSCKALGGDPSKAVITASALELFHNWILIHDDVEDQSEMRRGKPALHKCYGLPLAINAGDALHAKMWEAVMRNRSILGDAASLDILSEFVTMLNQTTEGQHVEVSWIEGGKWDLSEEDYYEMCFRKTSWYTCISPCRVGACIAGFPTSKLDSITPFGRDMGIAFQITDDLLNLEAEESKYGKERFGDLLEGKRTLMLIRLINMAKPEDRARVLAIMGKSRNERTEGEAWEVMELMHRYGVLDYARTKAMRFKDRAKDGILIAFPGDQYKRARDLLNQFVDFVVTRTW